MLEFKKPKRNPRARFSDEQVYEIKDMLKAGAPLADIALKFKCTKGMISAIKHGHSYFGVKRENIKEPKASTD